MSVQQTFIDDHQVEKEVLHDLKWPRILINAAGEVLSVGMAKRIMRMIQEGMSYEAIPEKFYEEWDREIDADTVEAVYELDFEPTDLPVPNGEHLVYPESPAIDHPDFVRGTIIPSGIYWQIVDLRHMDLNFIAQYVSHRWGFDVSEFIIARLLDQWQERLPRDENGVPIEPLGSARPPHPGRLMVDLPTRLSEAQDRRSSFSMPPPMYSPRPRWGGLTLRHPREVAGSGELDIPPFARPGDDFPGLPDYSAGDSTPEYLDLVAERAIAALTEATAALAGATAALTEAPGAPTEAPGAPTQAPGAPTQAPGAPTQAPGAPTEATAALIQVTGAPTQAPGAPTEATAAPTQATAAPTQAPGAPTQAPGAPTEATAALIQVTVALTGATTALAEIPVSSESIEALVEATTAVVEATTNVVEATAAVTEARQATGAPNEATQATGAPTEAAGTTEATQAVEATGATAATEATAATVVTEATEATEAPQAVEEPPSSPRRQVPSDPKHPTWPICPAVLSGRFTRDDIAEYLFDGMNAGSYTYGDGPHAPSEVRRPQTQDGETRIRRILMSAAEDRATANESNTLVWSAIDTRDPTPWDVIDDEMGEDIQELFPLLQNHEAFEPVRIYYDNNLTPSGNARELVNHLRERRGFDRFEFGGLSSALVADIMELLQWVKDPSVMESLNEFSKDFPWNFESLHALLEEVSLRQFLVQQNRNRAYQINHRLGENPGGNDEDDERDGFQVNAMVVDEPEPPLNHAVVDQPPADAPQPQSRRLASTLSLLEFANTDVRGARVARHERIFHRLAEWLTLLVDLPENRDAGEEIAGKLQEYLSEIENLKAHPTYQSRLWSLGHQCEVMLADLEIQTFVRMFSVDPDGTLQWEARFSDWTAKWARSFADNVYQLFADHDCMNAGTFRSIHLMPQALEVRPVVSHPNVVQDVRYVTDLWAGFMMGPIWNHLRHHFDSLVRGDNVGPVALPAIMMDMRHKFIVALLTLDSCVMIRDPDSLFGDPHHPLIWDNGTARPSGFEWNLGADVAPTPADNTDQLPNRAINMGAGRSRIYESAMERANVAQRVVYLVAPRENAQNVNNWLDHVGDVRDDGDEDVDMFAEDDPEPAVQLYIPPPPPRAALAAMPDGDGDIEMGDDDDDDDLPDYDSDMFSDDEMDID